MDRGIKLAMETGIRGGSLSIVTENGVLDNWRGNKETAKADFLLEGISQILKKNRIKRKAIREILCSTGPGSQTGLKIGISLAKGLGMALGIPLRTRDLFECIYKNQCRARAEECLIILPGGRKDFFWKCFDSNGKCIESGKTNASDNGMEKSPIINGEQVNILAPLTFLGEGTLPGIELGGRKNNFVDLGDALSDYIGLC
jgi:tRNA threonylcarbamoyl adenosine modification protein YeaZ